MQKILYFLLILSVLQSCKSKSSNAKDEESTKDLLDTTYTITGYINGTSQETKIILTYLGIDRKPDTTIFKGDNFVFKGKTPEPFVGEITYLDSANHFREPLKLMIENAVINIEGQKDSIQNSTVIGGLENTDFRALKKILQLHWDTLNALAISEQKLTSINDTVKLKKMQTDFVTMENETRIAIKEYAIEHPTSVASAYYVLQYYSSDINIPQLDSIYNSFDSSIRTSTYVKKIKETLDKAKITAVGQVAPELNLKDVSGKTDSLSLHKGKYVLIDFWASWCVPCRQENPTIVKAYNIYKNKGFDVIGVALDSSKQEWQKAIKKDKLQWKQLSDLQGWKSKAASLYGITNIPSNILLDKEGKIIAKNLHGETLTSKLQELIK